MGLSTAKIRQDLPALWISRADLALGAIALLCQLHLRSHPSARDQQHGDSCRRRNLDSTDGGGPRW